MVHHLDFKNKFKTLKIFVFGLVLGALAVSFLLDNRYQALYKAFMNPVVVNSLEVKVEVKK